MLTSNAHAKLILAGEHAVIYGSPAITTRLNWQTTCDFSLSKQNQLILTNQEKITWTDASLKRHWQALNERHQAWQTNTNTPLLQGLADLPLAVFAWWQQYYPLPLFNCQIHSDIPIGQGLGSSASLIIALLRGLAALTNITLSNETYQQAATQLENLAHGKSSGLDVAAILTSDRTGWQAGKASVLAHFPVMGYLINTGKAQSSTADCVSYVRQHHQNSCALWQNFSQVTIRLQEALIQQNIDEITTAVSQIHHNLCTIGIVPMSVQTFAKTAQEKYNWTGKLCGAGSITGDGGGFFWLLADKAPSVLCDQFGYDYWLLSTISSNQRDNTCVRPPSRRISAPACQRLPA
jgi:mevalonate kinase